MNRNTQPAPARVNPMPRCRYCRYTIPPGKRFCSTDCRRRWHAEHQVQRPVASLPVVEERERRLLPEDEKMARADYTYINTGSLKELDAFVAGVMAELAA